MTQSGPRTTQARRRITRLSVLLRQPLPQHITRCRGEDPAANPNRPEFVGFYRWHVLDPVMFNDDLRVTIQQIGAVFFKAGKEAELEAYERDHPVAGAGWTYPSSPALLAWGIAERVDDYCATSYVYCQTPQPVPRLDLAAAVADISRRPYEVAHPMEAGFTG